MNEGFRTLQVTRGTRENPPRRRNRCKDALFRQSTNRATRCRASVTQILALIEYISQTDRVIGCHLSPRRLDRFCRSVESESPHLCFTLLLGGIDSVHIHSRSLPFPSESPVTVWISESALPGEREKGRIGFWFLDCANAGAASLILVGAESHFPSATLEPRQTLAKARQGWLVFGWRASSTVAVVHVKRFFRFMFFPVATSASRLISSSSSY